jgi:uncharacterized delta-60 repeat protein
MNDVYTTNASRRTRWAAPALTLSLLALCPSAASAQVSSRATLNPPALPGARTLWAARYDASRGDNEWARALATGPGGRTLVTGYAKTGFSARGMLTISYDEAGEIEWTDSYNGPSDFDHGYDVLLDSAGNAYVLGEGYDDTSGQLHVEIVLIKYSPAGERLWVRRYGTAGANDQPSAAILDSAGNIVIAGASWIDAGDGHFDALLLKYDADGNLLWERTHDQQPGSNRWDVHYALAAGPDDSIAAVGWHDQFGNNWSAWLITRYDADGNFLWSESLGGIYTNVDEAWDVVVDPDTGDIYVSGDLGQPYVSTDMGLAKYSADGVFAWQRTYGGTSERGDYGRNVALDADGNVILAGTLWNENQPFEEGTMTAVKHAPNGSVLWRRDFVGEYYFAVTEALAVDERGGVYVAGYAAPVDANGTYDLVTVKWTAAGALSWDQRYNGPGDNDDEARDIAVDDDGNVYVTGRSFGGTTTYYDIVTIKYEQGATVPRTGGRLLP